MGTSGCASCVFIWVHGCQTAFRLRANSALLSVMASGCQHMCAKLSQNSRWSGHARRAYRRAYRGDEPWHGIVVAHVRAARVVRSGSAMEILDCITEQIAGNRLPLVGITVAAVPCPDTPIILTLHWHGFRKEAPADEGEA